MTRCLDPALLVLAALLLCAGTLPALAQAPGMPLSVAVDPAEQAQELTFSWTFDATPPLELADGDAISEQQPVKVSVPLGDQPLEDGTLTVRWGGGMRSNFPVVLGASFAERPVYIKLLYRRFQDTPRQSTVSEACVQIEPSDIETAFDMYFECREMALSLERANRKWQKAHRIALEGWLVANYFLYTRIAPVSPYGADPDLLTRLKEILREHEQHPNGDWGPLRLEDARNLIRFEDGRTIRLSGQVGQLMKLRQYEAASQVNAAALKVLEDTGITAAYGISQDVLKGNQDLLRAIGF